MKIHEWTDEENEGTILSMVEAEQVELNALDFFVHAMSYFEEEVEGKLSTTGQSPESFRSESFTRRSMRSGVS